MATNNLNRYNGLNIKFDIIKSKQKLFNDWYRHLMNICLQMFDYDDLPESMPKDDLEFFTMSNTYSIIGEHDGKLYAFISDLGGKENGYYIPRLAVVANPYLNVTKTYEIGKDCVLFLNDKMFMGLSTKIQKYASLLTTAEISFYWNCINTRTQKVFATPNNDIANSLKDVFGHIEDGDELKSITDKPLFELLKNFEWQSSSNTVSNLKSLIETKQYILASFFIDIGLNANYNMKRESLNENEINADTDTLIPLIDNMLECRQNGIKQMNEMFGTKTKVRLSSRWEDIRKALKYQLEEQKHQAESNDSESQSQENEVTENVEK